MALGHTEWLLMLVLTGGLIFPFVYLAVFLFNSKPDDADDGAT